MHIKLKEADREKQILFKLIWILARNSFFNLRTGQNRIGILLLN